MQASSCVLMSELACLGIASAEWGRCPSNWRPQAPGHCIGSNMQHSDRWMIVQGKRCKSSHRSPRLARMPSSEMASLIGPQCRHRAAIRHDIGVVIIEGLSLQWAPKATHVFQPFGSHSLQASSTNLVPETRMRPGGWPAGAGPACMNSEGVST